MYSTILLLILAIVLLAGLIRAIIRPFLFKRQIGLPIKKGWIPVYSNQLLYDKIHEGKTNLIGMILRFAGGIMLTVVLILQMHTNEVTLTHLYGLILGYYEAPDYTILWNVMTAIGGILLVFGILVRLVMTKRLTKYFGLSNPVVDFVGMLLPGFFELYLAFSKKYKFILSKNPKKMSREEYLLYTMLSEEE